MYTKEKSYNQVLQDVWSILDPDGDVVCDVVGEFGANAILSHLNK